MNGYICKWNWEIKVLFFFSILEFLDLPTNEEEEDFLEEISLMKKLGSHPNVLGMLGCCKKSTPRCIVLEYMEYGDLLHFLREKRKKVPTTVY